MLAPILALVFHTLAAAGGSVNKFGFFTQEPGVYKYNVALWTCERKIFFT
jgi:hypothetical protein